MNILAQKFKFNSLTLFIKFHNKYILAQLVSSHPKMICKKNLESYFEYKFLQFFFVKSQNYLCQSIKFCSSFHLKYQSYCSGQYLVGYDISRRFFILLVDSNWAFDKILQNQIYIFLKMIFFENIFTFHETQNWN